MLHVCETLVALHAVFLQSAKQVSINVQVGSSNLKAVQVVVLQTQARLQGLSQDTLT